MMLVPEGWSLELLALLWGVAVLAGWVDAIAGGGGLLTVPALFLTGLSPVEVLATNKVQGACGSLAAVWRYTQLGLVRPREHRLAVVLAFSGGAIGAVSVQWLDTALLEWIVPLLLMVFAAYWMFAPKLAEGTGRARVSYPIFAGIAGLTIGFYDGFFGPGAGSFYALAFVTLLGYSLPQATGGTKLLNLSSNLAALLLFALSGQVWWWVGGVLGLGQALGGYLGAQTVSRHGTRLIRPLLVVVSLAVSVKLLLR
jgi:uncharacterized membrane protein YfcA